MAGLGRRTCKKAGFRELIERAIYWTAAADDQHAPRTALVLLKPALLTFVGLLQSRFFSGVYQAAIFDRPLNVR
jgi:hypothetical protein